MSDLGRKDFSDKVGEGLKPDSEKSTFERGKEGVTNAVDNAAGKLTPDDQKSFPQTAADKFKQGKDDAKETAEKDQHSFADTAKEYVDSAKKSASGAANYISEVVGGASQGAKSASDDVKK